MRDFSKDQNIVYPFRAVLESFLDIWSIGLSLIDEANTNSRCVKWVHDRAKRNPLTPPLDWLGKVFPKKHQSTSGNGFSFRGACHSQAFRSPSKSRNCVTGGF
ncbi:unnamed protein product [Sphacelaria rigidula]